MRQPDFRKIFYDYLGGVPKKVAYKVRRDSNQLHDMMFLKSLVHDAGFRRDSMRLRGRHLTILINRDCWELWPPEYPKPSEVYNANARLDIAPVLEIKWHFDEGVDLSPSTELLIRDLILIPAADEILTLNVQGFRWNCCLTVMGDDLRIVLRDLEVPHSFSRSEQTGGTGKPK